MVVWDLGEEVMYDMRSNVMVDVINPSIVTIKCCKPSSQITPFLFHFTIEKNQTPILHFYLSQTNKDN